MSTAESTLLLVEESRFFLTVEQQFLRHVPTRIAEARNASEALAFCAQSPPDLIYMAYDLPGMNGAQCCRELKANPQLCRIPVILIYEEAQQALAEVCRQAGCEALLTKPLNRHHFLEIGRSFLAGIRERRRPCLLKVQAQAGAHRFAANGLDISTGGIFLETAEELAPGTPLFIELQLARPGDHGPHFSCHAIAAWKNTRENPMKPNHPVGYGVKFTDIPAPSQAVLSGYLHTLEK